MRRQATPQLRALPAEYELNRIRIRPQNLECSEVPWRCFKAKSAAEALHLSLPCMRCPQREK